MQYLRLILWTAAAGASWGLALYIMAKILGWGNEKDNHRRDDSTD
jgi:hypothetical protein